MKQKQFEFFDKALMNATDKGVKRALSKFGAFVRTRAKSSIRKRKKISQPGSPPSSHTGKLKRLIFFGYDREKKSVVVGPLLFGSTNAAATARLRIRASARRARTRSRWSLIAQEPQRDSGNEPSARLARIGSGASPTGVPERLEKGVGIQARPFMTPAFETEKKNLESYLKDCIK